MFKANDLTALKLRGKNFAPRVSQEFHQHEDEWFRDADNLRDHQHAQAWLDVILAANDVMSSGRGL